MQDCTKYCDDNGQNCYILVNGPGAETGKVKRKCQPRDVVLAHSGAFAKYCRRPMARFLTSASLWWPGQHANRDDWTRSLKRVHAMHPHAVHFCHDTRVL